LRKRDSLHGPVQSDAPIPKEILDNWANRFAQKISLESQCIERTVYEKATSGEPTRRDGNMELIIVAELRRGGPVPRLEVIQAEAMSMKDVVNAACRCLEAYMSAIL
jgi:hypothetical protein